MAAGTASAATLSKQERDALIKHLKNSEKMLKRATKGLTPEQWKYKAAADRWSVQDCVEHLALTEEFLFNMVQERVMKAPATPGDAAQAREGDAFLMKAIPDRSNKAQAPEPLRPSGKWATPQQMLAAFAERRKKTVDYVKKTQDDLRAHKMDGPVRKQMDAYQWLVLVSAHTERHTAQALEVKASPNFPKK
jgi:hypothetical protein